MATLTVTIPAGGQAGSVLRKLAKNLDKLASGMPDVVAGGASTVLTINNAPSTGTVSVEVTAGPYPKGPFIA